MTTTDTGVAAAAILPKTARAYVSLLLGVLCIGFSGIFARSADAPGIVMAVWRVGTATAVLAIPFLRQPAPQRRVRRSLLAGAMLGGLLFSGDLGLWNASLDHTTAANATFLGNASPIWVGLLTLFVLREGLPRRFWPGVSVAVGGAAFLIFGGGDVRARQGDLMALTASVFWASYQVVTGRVRPHLSNLSYIWVMSATSFLILLPVPSLSGYALVGYSADATLKLLGAGLVSQVGGYLGINYALGHLPAARVSVALLLQPVLTAILAYLLLGESFGGWRLLGGGLILAGVYLVTRPEGPFLRRSRPPDSPVNNSGPPESAARQKNSISGR